MAKLFAIVCFIGFLSCSNVKKTTFSDENIYYTITNDGIQKLKFQNDSLFFIGVFETADNLYNFSSEKEDVERTTYHIKESASSDNKTILFLQNEETKNGIKKCFLIFDSSKNKLSLLLEDTLFSSIESAKKYIPDFENKFFRTFYSKTLMDKYSRYTTAFAIDSIARVNFVNDLIKTGIDNKQRIGNTKSKGIFFFAGRDIITSSFLKSNLNPFINMDSINLLIRDNEFIKSLD